MKATDDSGVAPDCELTTITADEGSTADAKITAPLSGQVRALRNRHQDERVYTFRGHVRRQGWQRSARSGERDGGQESRGHPCRALARVTHQPKCLLAQHRLSEKDKGRR